MRSLPIYRVCLSIWTLLALLCFETESYQYEDGLSGQDFINFVRNRYSVNPSEYWKSLQSSRIKHDNSRIRFPIDESSNQELRRKVDKHLYKQQSSSPSPQSEKLQADAPEELLKKPTSEQWILGREPKEKLNLISWIIDGCFWYPIKTSSVKACDLQDSFDKNTHPSEFQTFDGFFNNPFKVDLGAVDTPLLRRVPPVYKDGVYEPVSGDRINPFHASNLMKRMPDCKDPDFPNDPSKKVACGSRTGKTAFLVFFGQQVVEEMLDAQRPGCPPEYFNVEIPKDHEFSKTKSAMPFLRSRWSQSTGHSSGNPRQQLNEITPYIDGGLIYGTSKGWSDVLRTRPNGSLVEYGLLASVDDEGYFPVRNNLRLPMANPPPPANHSTWVKESETAEVKRFFVLGNPRGNENAFLLSFGVVLFRWHNSFATYLHLSRPTWSGERIFQEARKWVIGTYQHIVMYDWLPEWLGEPMDEYREYDPAVDPQIEQFFQTAAMRFGHTLVTPGAYLRDYACAGCKPVSFHGLGGHRQKKEGSLDVGRGAVRTCNIFWRGQEPLEMKFENDQCIGIEGRKFADVDRLLMGMASQKAEREDNMIVDDLRGRVFGPLEFSRRDLMAVNIQRGRDHGTPDYNTAREAFGLPKITSVDEYMKLTGTFTPKQIVKDLESIHNKTKTKAWDNIDVWTGGILETSYRPGPLFRTIIKDQFNRIRNADRFWFENKKWKKPRFTDKQIQRIKTLKIFDLVVSVTHMLAEDIQSNPFRVPDDEFKQKSGKCFSSENTSWETGTCENYDGKTGEVFNSTTCYHFPQLDSPRVPVEECTPLGTYDYFDGSEISFILTFVFLGLIIIGIASLVPVVASFRKKDKQNELKKLQSNIRKSFKQAGLTATALPVSAREWQSSKEGSRAVALLLTDKGVLEVRSHKGELLRLIDLSMRTELDLIVVTDGKHLVIKNPKEYDCVFLFEGKYLRNSFLNLLKQRFELTMDIHETSSGLHLASILTRDKRLKRLEKFFKLVFAQAFAIDQPKGEEELQDPNLLKEVINTELTKAEFALALGMESGSQFVEKMFNMIDRDQNGYISFREFLDMIIIFAEGTAEDKARLMFEMYDISRTGTLTSEEFKCMVRSMVEAANADINEEELERITAGMLDGVGLKRDSKVTLEDFQKLMSDHKDTLGYAQLNFSGVNVPESQQKGKTKSRNEMARQTVFSIYGGRKAPTEDPGKSSAAEDVRRKKELERSKKEESNVTLSEDVAEGTWSKWIELYRLQMFWGTMYVLVVIAIFAERAYVYSVEKEHGGLRHIAGYGVTVTRGAASVMMFTYATLLLTMCRNMITRLRETVLHRFIPFDSAIAMHKFVAMIGLLFSLIHIIGHAINFYHISTQTPSDLSCLFRDYHRPTHVLPKFHYWCFQTITGLTGILLVLLGTLIYTFATNYARANAYRMFWITHATYPLWYILMLLHGSGRLVQEPLFFNFLVGPLVLFVLDRLVSASRKQVEIPVLRAEILPSKVTMLEFARPTGFEYKSGQWVRIASSALSPNEFHPFTLSSAPHEQHLSLHIRAVGPFTANIRQIYERSKPTLYLDGPYGEGHQDWWRYEVSVLVGGGIGVTPFASILKDVATNAHPRSCKKIYFLWVTRTQKQFEWLVDIIREVEEHKLISIHVFITQIYHKFDLRTVLLYIFERHFQRINNRSLFTGLKSVTHFGRPNFQSFFQSLRALHPTVSKFGVFSCGPFPMTKTVDEACIEVSNLTDARGSVFQHHFENF